jgi:hypothetical protein
MAQDKADFANAFARFIENRFHRAAFPCNHKTADLFRIAACEQLNRPLEKHGLRDDFCSNES